MLEQTYYLPLCIHPFSHYPSSSRSIFPCLSPNSPPLSLSSPFLPYYHSVFFSHSVGTFLPLSISVILAHSLHFVFCLPTRLSLLHSQSHFTISLIVSISLYLSVSLSLALLFSLPISLLSCLFLCPPFFL